MATNKVTLQRLKCDELWLFRSGVATRVPSLSRHGSGSPIVGYTARCGVLGGLQVKIFLANTLVVLCVISILGDSIAVDKHPVVGTAAAMGTFTGILIQVFGLYFSCRWRMTLARRTHKVGRQTGATILFWYFVLAALIFCIALVGVISDGVGAVFFGIVGLIIWVALACVCHRWLARLRREEIALLCGPAVAAPASPPNA